MLPLSVTDESSTTILGNENDFKVLTSPGYPNNYPVYADVTFVILSPEDSNVKLDFLDLDIHEGCSHDVLYIYDGKSHDPMNICQLLYKDSLKCRENIHLIIPSQQIYFLQMGVSCLNFTAECSIGQNSIS